MLEEQTSREFPLSKCNELHCVHGDLHRGAGVWLAGHSLGAAMALLAGKEIAKKTTNTSKRIEAYLFNPPFCSDLITGWIKNKSVNFGIQLTKNVVKLIDRRFGKDHQHREAQANDAFDAYLIGFLTFLCAQMILFVHSIFTTFKTGRRCWRLDLEKSRSLQQ